MAKDKEVEWRRMRRLNGEGSIKVIIDSKNIKYFIIIK